MNEQQRNLERSKPASEALDGPWVLTSLFGAKRRWTPPAQTMLCRHFAETIPYRLRFPIGYEPGRR